MLNKCTPHDIFGVLWVIDTESTHVEVAKLGCHSILVYGLFLESCVCVCVCVVTSQRSCCILSCVPIIINFVTMAIHVSIIIIGGKAYQILEIQTLLQSV